jgi:hypothetical protein
MFRSSRKSIWSSRSSLYQRKKVIPRWQLAIAIPACLLGAELLVRLGVQLAGKTAELSAFQGEPLSITAYRLKYLDQSGRTMDGLPTLGQLAVRRSPVMGYRLVENQDNKIWKINQQGFRNEALLSVEKPKDEIRIFVLGGSTAFGQLSSSNQTTFTHKLEAKLNQQVSAQKSNPDKFRPDVLPYYADELEKTLALPPRIREAKYRVINAAVPGYISSNEFSRLSFEILPYKPDLVVVLNGYTDLLLPSQQEGTDIPGTELLLSNAPRHLWSGVTQGVQSFFYQFFVVKAFQYWVLQPQAALEQAIPPNLDAKVEEQIAQNPEELNHRVDRYRRNMGRIAQLTSANKTPLIVALQPEITGRNREKLSDREKKVLEQLGNQYPEQLQKGYEELQKALEQVKQEVPQGISVMNFYDSYVNYQGNVFQDAIHLTDEANTLLTDRLYDAIVKRLQQQPKPYAGSEPPPSTSQVN